MLDGSEDSPGREHGELWAEPPVSSRSGAVRTGGGSPATVLRSPILGRTAQAAPCSDGVYGSVAGLPHGRAYGVGSDAGQAGDAVVGGGLGYREGDLRRGGAEVIDGR